jgi:hypothetical protein
MAVPSMGTLSLLLAAVIGLPMLINFFKLSTSISLGTGLAAVVAIWLQWSHGARASATNRALAVALAVSAGIALHLGLASAGRAVDLGRGLGSLPLLVVFVIGAASAADLLARARPRELQRVMHLCTRLLMAIGFWAALGLPEPSYGAWSKPIFPFTEPSHFALVLGPFLIYVCVTSRLGLRLAYLGAALLLTGLLESTTLAAIVLVTLLLCLHPRWALITLALVVPIVASLDLTYYLSRLDFSEDSGNLTALVYLQGWQLIGESWDGSGGLGIGFQQLGVGGTDVLAAQLIATALDDPDGFLNLFDGGFTFAKIVSEFGVFGLGALLAYAPFVARAVARLHRHAARTQARDPFSLFCCAFIVAYLFELFLRGNGYFTPTGLLALAAVWAWRRLPGPASARLARGRRRAPSPAAEAS